MSTTDSNAQMPSELVAASIRRERLRAGLSLSALAEQAGLAKSTLSQLESGKGNPNIETLWAIAQALGVPFSALFEQAAQQCELVRAGEGVVMSADAPGIAAVLLTRCPPGRRRDLFRLDLDDGAVRQADPHPPGTVEHMIVVSGSLRAGPTASGAELLHPGDYFRFPSDVAHFYVAEQGPACVICITEAPD